MAEQRIVLLSGRIASGKSELARRLSSLPGSVLVKTKDMILRHSPRTPVERRPMQKVGDRLDRETDGQWISSELANRIRTEEATTIASLVVVDAVRIKKQIDHIRHTFSSGYRVVHVHVTAPEHELERRFKERQRPGDPEKYEDVVIGNRTERQVEKLLEVADIVISTYRCTAEDVLMQAIAALGLRVRSVEPCVDVLVGGQYGSEGKGHVASYLAKEYGYLLRVGGPNAGHKVYLGDPHTYNHLPSGTQHNKTAKLILGPGAQIRVAKLLSEIGESFVEHGRLWIDPQAMIIEDQDVKEETKLVDNIASTGQGVGASAARRIMGRGDPEKKVRLAADIPELQPYIRRTIEVLDEAYESGQKLFLEGTQGTSLSLFHGLYPHVTSRDTTASGCMAEAGIPARRVRKVIMVCRTYPIRVGDTKGSSGPMSQPLEWEEIAKRSEIPLRELYEKELTSTTKRLRRIAEFDWVQLRRSTLLNAPTDIALTFVDYLSIKNRDARRYEQLTDETIRFIEEVERVAAVSVSLINTRFHWRSVIDRRTW
jgi:adenylosuccinate synthase